MILIAEQNVSIQFDEVQCIGTEQSLNECTFITDRNCDHAEEAGVICIGSNYIYEQDVFIHKFSL